MNRKRNKLMKLPPVQFAVDMLDVYFSKRVGRAAAELAYFLILTFFPIIICVSIFVERLHLNPSTLLTELTRILPDGVIAVFQDYLRYVDINQSSAMLIGGIFMAVLFASAAVRALMNIMHEIYGRANFQGFWQLVASVLFAILLLATIYLSMAVVVTGNWFFRLLGQLLDLEGLVEQFAIWQWVKYLLLLSLVFLFILLLYRFAAPLRRPRPPVVPGALAAAVALAVASAVFSLLMGHSTRYSLVYGSLTSVIILLLWLYLCGNVLILGNAFNYVLYKRRQSKSGGA